MVTPKRSKLFVLLVFKDFPICVNHNFSKMRLLKPILIYFFCSEIQCENESSDKENQQLCQDLESSKNITADKCGCSAEAMKKTSVTDSRGTIYQTGPSSFACHTECMQQLGVIQDRFRSELAIY